MPAPPAVRHLSSRVVAYLQSPGGWFLNNAGWVTGAERTCLVDTCATEKRTRQLLEALRADTEARAPDTVVLTHAHGDHANGAGLLARAGSTVMASEPAAREITTGPHLYPKVFAYDGWGDVRPPKTITTITERVSFDLGGCALELIPVPTHAHTPGDLVVWLPQERVLFAGDLLFIGVTPLAVHGSIRGWLEALEWLAGFDAIHLVPGHGPVCTDGHEVIADIRGYLRWLLDVTAEDCPDFDALHEQASDRWSTWLDPERHVVNLRVAHAEVHGQPFDLVEALQALLRVNRGPIVFDL